MNSKRVASSPNACFINLFFSGIPGPSSTVTDGNFYNTTLSDELKSDIYVSSGSVKIIETSKQGRSGLVYNQTVTFALPTADNLRAQRIDQFKKVKSLTITLSDGKQLFFGRNDVHQNTKPKLKIISDEKLTKIQFKQKSIAPLGFLVNEIYTFQDGIQFLFQDGSSFNG